MRSSLANAKDFAKSCLYGLNFQAPIRAQSALATEIKYEMRSWLSGKHWRHHFMVMSSVRTPPALKKFPAMGFNYDDVRMGGSTGSPPLLVTNNQQHSQPPSERKKKSKMCGDMEQATGTTNVDRQQTRTRCEQMRRVQI